MIFLWSSVNEISYFKRPKILAAKEHVVFPTIHYNTYIYNKGPFSNNSPNNFMSRVMLLNLPQTIFFSFGNYFSDVNYLHQSKIIKYCFLAKGQMLILYSKDLHKSHQYNAMK